MNEPAGFGRSQKEAIVNYYNLVLPYISERLRVNKLGFEIDKYDRLTLKL